MFQVKSYRSMNKQNSLKNVFNQISNKVDYQIQCNFSDLPYKNVNRHIGHQSSSSFDFSLGNTNRTTNKFYQKQQNMNKTVNKLYENVSIKTVNYTQQKICKILQGISMGKIYDEQQLKLIKQRAIKFNSPQNQLDQSFLNDQNTVKITMQSIFRCYLQFHKEQLMEAKLKGNLMNKIIKPFLMVFDKMKQDSSFLKLKYQKSDKIKAKIVSKNQIFQIFHKYSPKQQANKQFDKTVINLSKVYQEMHKKYESIPFQKRNQIKQQPNQDEYDQNESNYTQQKTRKSQFQQQKYKIMQQLQQYAFDHNSLQNQDTGRLTKQSRQSTIKQRFQDRFKRQLRQLSQDANNILKANQA